MKIEKRRRKKEIKRGKNSRKIMRRERNRGRKKMKKERLEMKND